MLLFTVAKVSPIVPLVVMGEPVIVKSEPLTATDVTLPLDGATKDQEVTVPPLIAACN